MICEQEYCIYNEAEVCILDEISINALGHCDACIIATIPSTVLEMLKEQQLIALNKCMKGHTTTPSLKK